MFTEDRTIDLLWPSWLELTDGQYTTNSRSLPLRRGQVDDLIRRFRGALQDSGEEEQNVILAALARVTAEYLEGRSGNAASRKGEAG